MLIGWGVTGVVKTASHGQTGWLYETELTFASTWLYQESAHTVKLG